MTTAIIAGIVLTLGIVYFLTNKREEDELTGLYIPEPKTLLWRKNEIELSKKVNDLRAENGKEKLIFKKEAKDLSAARVAFWIGQRYTKEDNLHNYILGIAEEYEDSGLLYDVDECAQIIGYDAFNGFVKSPSHKASMLGKYKYIGITIVNKYCCLILAN